MASLLSLVKESDIDTIRESIKNIGTYAAFKMSRDALFQGNIDLYKLIEEFYPVYSINEFKEESNMLEIIYSETILDFEFGEYDPEVIKIVNDRLKKIRLVKKLISIITN